MSNEEVKVRITGDATGAETAFSRVSKSVRDFNSETAGALKNLQSHWMGMTAIAAGSAVAMSKAMDLMEQGAKAQQVESSFKIMADAAGINSDRMIASMKSATKQVIDDSDMMQKAIKLMTLGYDPSQIERFSKVVITASQIAGTTAAEAYDKLADAIANKAPKAMVAMGAVTKEQMKVVTAAIEGGAESTALFELAMANLELKQKMLQGTQDQTTLAIQRFHAQVSQTKEEVGKGLIVVLDGAYRMFEYLASGVLGLSANLTGLIAMYQRYRAAVYDAMGDEKMAAANRAVADEYMEFSKNAWGARNELIKKAGEAIYLTSEIGKTASKEEIKDAQDVVSAQMKKLNIYASSQKTNNEARAATSERERALDEYYKHEMEISKAVGKAEEDLTNDVRKGAESSIESLRRMSEEAERTRIQNIAIQARFYEDFDPFGENAHAAKMAQLEEYANAFREAKIAEVDIERWAAEERARLEYELFQKKTDYISHGFGELAASFDGISRLYAEGSDDAERWQAASEAMIIAQKAVAVVQAVGAIATQGLGDPYTAFVRIAAMAAAMGALLATIGESVNGSTAAASAPAMGNSTVLGAAYGTESESIANSLEILQDTYDLENSKLTKIYEELRDLNNNITGLVSGIIRTGGSFDGMSLEADSIAATKAREVFMGADIIRNGVTKLGDQLGIKNLGIWADPISYIVNNLLGDIINWAVSGIFGGKKTIGTIGAGYQIGGSSIQDILSGGVNTQQYQTLMSKTSGGWFGDDKVVVGTIYSKVDEEVASLFNKVFQNLAGTLVGLAELLGTDVNDALAYKFKDIKLNLMGKDGEEISKAISAALSAAGDNAAKALFGEIVMRYQKVNEGMLETAVRLVTDKESVLAVLRLTNQSFTGTTSRLIEFSEALIGVAGNLETLTDAFQTYYDAFFSDAEKQADTKRALSIALGGYGFDLPGTRSGYRDLVESLNLTTEAGMAAYVALMQMSESADAYYDYLEKAKGSLRESDYSTRAEYERAVRGFAGGGEFRGGWRVVGEGGPELEYTGPSQIKSTSDSRKALGTDELIAAVNALRSEVGEANFANTANSYKMARLLDKWDGEGIPAERT